MPEPRNVPTGVLADPGARPIVPTERVVARLRSHGRILFWPVLLAVILAGGTTYFWGVLPQLWQRWVLAGAALVVAVVFVVLPYLAWLSRRYTITTRRVIARSGFFVRERREIFHSRGYQVAVRRSWFQAIFRSGHVVLTTGVDKPLVLRDVPGARLVADSLNNLVERNQTALTP